jgi:ATP-dependent Clp protease ATP-binding subunit ClpA
MTMDAVIERAKSQSARLGHNYVGTEHALLAIVDDEPALLEPYGVTRQKVLQVLKCSGTE